MHVIYLPITKQHFIKGLIFCCSSTAIDIYRNGTKASSARLPSPSSASSKTSSGSTFAAIFQRRNLAHASLTTAWKKNRRGQKGSAVRMRTERVCSIDQDDCNGVLASLGHSGLCLQLQLRENKGRTMVLVGWGASVVSTCTNSREVSPSPGCCLCSAGCKSGTNVHVLCGGTQEFESLVVHESSLNSQ